MLAALDFSELADQLPGAAVQVVAHSAPLRIEMTGLTGGVLRGASCSAALPRVRVSRDDVTLRHRDKVTVSLRSFGGDDK
jgi:hypothetical protein